MLHTFNMSSSMTIATIKGVLYYFVGCAKIKRTKIKPTENKTPTKFEDINSLLLTSSVQQVFIQWCFIKWWVVYNSVSYSVS